MLMKIEIVNVAACWLQFSYRRFEDL